VISKWLLTILILVGLVAGIVVGQLLHDSSWTVGMPESEHAHATSLGVFTFLGNTVFMGLLRMLVIPLVGASVMVGVTSMGDFRQLGRIGLKTIVLYLVTTLIAVTIGLIMVNALTPGEKIGESQKEAVSTSHEQDPSRLKTIEAQAAGGMLGMVTNLVKQLIPQNVISAAAKGQPLPIIFFAIFFGVIVTLVGEKGRIIAQFVEAVFEVLMRMVQVVLWLAPVGVFALMAWSIARIGLQIFAESIGLYMLTVLMGLGLHGLIVLPLMCLLLARANPFVFFHQMRQALMTALGTDSSSATLPVTIECATELGGVSKKAAGFVLPLGSTINMDGTALYEAVAVVFMAQAYNVPLDFGQMVLVAITATLAAIGAAGIPSAGLVTMVIVIEAVNGSVLAANPELSPIPLAAIGLIIGVDRLLDMVRTTVNVWGDCVVAKIISRSES
jgi:Na+/H+-dicarboxylate symporter